MAAKHGTSKATRSLPELISAEQLAQALQIPISTIYYWRLRGEGPQPVRVGRYLRFDVADVASWIESRKALT